MRTKHFNTWGTVLHRNPETGTFLVRLDDGVGIHATPKKELRYLISLKDRVHVIQSHVSHEWIIIDYIAMWTMTSGDEEEVTLDDY